MNEYINIHLNFKGSNNYEMDERIKQIAQKELEQEENLLFQLRQQREKVFDRFDNHRLTITI